MDEITPQFEQALELDMKRLAETVKEHRESSVDIMVGDREVIKHAIQSLSDDASAPAPQVKSAAAGSTVIDNPLPDYAASAPAETKLEIEYLLELAFKKGIVAANKEAGQSSAFVRDAFHDALTGKLYPELQKRGIV